MTILICGSRDYADDAAIVRALTQRQPSAVICGDARGADALAYAAAHRLHIPCTSFSADWYTYGKSAGMKRNSQMLTEGQPHEVWAFYRGDIPTRGTHDMMRQAIAAGLPVFKDGLLRIDRVGE